MHNRAMEEFNLERFEHLAYTRNHEPAARELTRLLVLLDSRYGNLQEGFTGRPLAQVPPSEVDMHVITRLAGAMSALFSDPNFNLSPQGFDQLLTCQRWIASIFASSSFRNTDHIIRALNIHGGNLDHLTLADHRSLMKFCLLFTPESEINLDVDVLWAHNPRLTAMLCCVLMSPRFLASAAAHHKREVLLKWLPSRLIELGDINLLPTGIIHDVYMHCSYADLAEKHEIKRAINILIRKKMQEKGVFDLHHRAQPRSENKPLMLVVPEWLSAAHSVYRTHGVSLRGAREHFHLLGVGRSDLVDDAARKIFHEFVELKADGLWEQIEQIHQLARAREPQVIYYPAVGMFPLTIYLSNLRLAPLQVTALGHAASTFSPFIDYFMIDEDFVGDASCFSETLLRLPASAMPQQPSALLPADIKPRMREANPEKVRIAVAATVMKLNPRFLTACQEIVRQSRVRVHFEFLVGQAQGLLWCQVQNVVHNFLGDAATIHHHQNYPDYLQSLNKCDMFINAFPYGNMNGIADTTILQLPGVCLDGREPHAHIDAGMFRRVNLPEWLITSTVEEYVAAACRLAEESQVRLAISAQLRENKAVERLYAGDPELCAETLLGCLLHKQAA